MLKDFFNSIVTSKVQISLRQDYTIYKINRIHLVHSVNPVILSNMLLESATEIKVEPTTAAALSWEEGLQESGERCEVSRLNQQLTRPGKLRDDTFTTHHAAEESRCRFAQRVLRRAFPRDEVSGIDHVTLTHLQSFTMNRAERRNKQK